jgi:hypothetical protein
MLTVSKDTRFYKFIRYIEPAVGKAPYWIWRGGTFLMAQEPTPSTALYPISPWSSRGGCSVPRCPTSLCVVSASGYLSDPASSTLAMTAGSLPTSPACTATGTSPITTSRSTSPRPKMDTRDSLGRPARQGVLGRATRKPGSCRDLAPERLRPPILTSARPELGQPHRLSPGAGLLGARWRHGPSRELDRVRRRRGGVGEMSRCTPRGTLWRVYEAR